LIAVGFAFFVSAIAGVLSGLTPAFIASQVDFRTALSGGTRTAGSIGSDRTRRVLVFAEVALCALLATTSGLMMRSFISLSNVNPGFQYKDVLAADVVLRQDRYANSGDMLRFYRRALQKLLVLPGVERAGMITLLPFGGNDWGNSFEVEGQPAPRGKSYEAQIRPVSDKYFAVMNIPLQRGRDFTEKDSESGAGVAIVNEKLARQFWSASDPIGKHIRFDWNWLTVVGVVGNTKHSTLDADFQPEIYVPYPQLSPTLLNFVGRENNYVVANKIGGAAQAIAIRNAIHSLDPEMVVKVDTMEHLIDDSLAQPRLRTWLILTFSLLALVLVSVGIYGLISYTVTQRYRDFGIRIALGAERGNILKLVLGGATLIVSFAVAVGGVTALYVCRFLQGLLFGITARDPITFIGVAVLLISIGLLASYVPARRATQINPVVALRYE
jgi:putative ABC transport system permease protein